MEMQPGFAIKFGNTIDNFDSSSSFILIECIKVPN